MSKKSNFDEFWSRQFEKVGNMPIAWQAQARDLLYAADCLYQRGIEKLKLRLQFKVGEEIPPDIFHASLGIDFMLFGLAIENLVKGLLVAKGEPATSDGKLSKKISTHNLVKLFKYAKVEISVSDKRFLKQLQRCIESGKYPIARIPVDPAQGVPLERKHAIRLFVLLENKLHDYTPNNSLAPLKLK